MKRRFYTSYGSFHFNDGVHLGYSTYAKRAKLMEWVESEPYEGIFFVDAGIYNGFMDNRPVPKYGWLLESPAVNATLMDDVLRDPSRFAERYDNIFTHDHRLVAMHEKFKWIPAMGHWVKSPCIHHKSKLVSMITSNKNWLPGHRSRLAWADRLKDQLDLYGYGIRYIAKVEDALNDYMFSVAIENTVHPGYFTEKILNCFACGTIPIYHGAPDIGNYFNPRGILPLEDPIKCSEELYLERMDAVVDNFNRVHDYELVEDYIVQNYLNLQQPAA